MFTSIFYITGRPRPDFFWRCFPNGEMNNNMECTGDPDEIREGRKSFPSGHSSCKREIVCFFFAIELTWYLFPVSFVSMCFIALYLMGKLHVFGERGRGQSWRLLISITPLFFAMLVAVSRTCDYHHHWQDVTVGSLLGILIACVCYRQYFPSLSSRFADRSYLEIKMRDLNGFPGKMTKSSMPTESKSFLDEEKDTKWI